jgi:ligand-binding SRPBCC domain-containing protein
MSIYELDHKQWVPHPVQQVFQFFSAAENLEQLTPPFLRFHITRNPPRLDAGARIEYKLRVHGLPIRWLTVIEKWDPPHLFVDVQEKGPYKLWHHTHLFRPENGGTRIEDHVRYSLPFGLLGKIAHCLMVRRDVEAIFRYREQRIREIFPDPGL